MSDDRGEHRATLRDKFRNPRSEHRATAVPPPRDQFEEAFRDVVAGGKEMLNDRVRLQQELAEANGYIKRWERYGAEVATEIGMLREQLNITTAQLELYRSYSDEMRSRMMTARDAIDEGLKESKQYAQSRLKPRLPRDYQIPPGDDATELINGMSTRDRPGSQFTNRHQDRGSHQE